MRHDLLQNKPSAPTATIPANGALLLTAKDNEVVFTVGSRSVAVGQWIYPYQRMSENIYICDITSLDTSTCSLKHNN